MLLEGEMGKNIKHLWNLPQGHRSLSAHDPSPVREIVDPVGDIVHVSLTSIASRTSPFGGDWRRPLLRERHIDSNGVRIQHENIRSGGVFRPVMVRTVQNQGDGVIWVE